MPKLKVDTLAIKEDGSHLGRVCEGTVKGEDVSGQYVVISPASDMSQDAQLGYVSEAADGHLLIDTIEPDQAMEVEDRSAESRGQGGPSKVNSNAFRSGWERTFSN